MKRAFTALFLCLAILLGIAETASGAYVDPGVKNRVGGFWENPNIPTYEIDPFAPETHRKITIPHYDIATDVVFYANQNPWSFWDPLGLESENERRARARAIKAQQAFQASPSVGGFFRTLGAGLRGVGAMLNPVNSDSSLRDANRQFAGGVDQARRGINDSPVPGPLKAVAKAGLATGSAAHSTNPLVATADVTELAGAVRENGIVQTGKDIVAAAVALVEEDPGYAVAALGAAVVTRKAPNPATKNRVKLRKKTKQEIVNNQPRNSAGEMIDPNTGQPLKPDEIDVGHKTGQEWRKRKRMHDERGSTRKEVLDAENDPDLYHLEDRSSNRSRRHEAKD